MEEKQDNKVAVPQGSPTSKALAIGNEIKQILAGHELEKQAMIIGAMFASGLFKDITSISRIVAKVLVGHQMGLNVVQSVNGINVIDNRISMDSHTVREKCLEAGYDIKTIKSTDKECELKWFKDDAELGTTRFTWEDAERAGLTVKRNWQQWPGDMLYARATTQGARRFAIKAFGGQAVYDRDELGNDRITVNNPNPIVTDDMVDQVLNTKATEKETNAKEAQVVGDQKDAKKAKQ